MNKKNALCVKFYMKKKQCTFGNIFLPKNHTLCGTFLYPKDNALCVTFIYIKFIVWYILIPNYKLMYNQIDQIDKYFLISLLRIGTIPTINK